MAAIPYSSQAGGYFQKLHTAGKACIPQNRLALYDLPVNDRRYQMLLELSQQTGQTIDMLVLGYLLAQPFPVFPIIGRDGNTAARWRPASILAAGPGR